MHLTHLKLKEHHEIHKLTVDHQVKILDLECLLRTALKKIQTLEKRIEALENPKFPTIGEVS